MIRKALIAAVLAVGLVATGTAAAGGWYGGYYHQRDRYHDHDGDALAAGIVFGALVGIALSDSWYGYDSYDYRPYGYRNYYYRPAPRYVPPRYVPPRAVYAPVPAVRAGTCLQTREYTTTVTIGGRAHEAYGTACLQPDGSWLRGPAKLVPEY